MFATISGVLAWYEGEDDDYNSPINRAVRGKIDSGHRRNEPVPASSTMTKSGLCSAACDQVDPTYGRWSNASC